MQAALARGTEPLDDVTLRRAQRGDERAWRELIASHERAVHALIWRILVGRARHRVEDLVQETFVRVVRALPEFRTDGPASLSTWILTIATRLALNELRRPQHAELASEPLARERTDASSERARLGATIALAMAELSDAHRAVIVLREYHDLDYLEIANILETDVGTVKSRLSRARAALRGCLVRLMPELGEPR